MNTLSVRLMSWRGDRQADDGDPHGQLIGDTLAVNGERLMRGDVSLHFGEISISGTDFLVLEIRHPDPEFAAKFGAEDVMLGSTSERLLLPVALVELPWATASAQPV